MVDRFSSFRALLSWVHMEALAQQLGCCEECKAGACRYDDPMYGTRLDVFMHFGLNVSDSRTRGPEFRLEFAR